ncbi:hypothetical protein [Aminobacter sp. MSH1]|uniref:hypothetical protein n=1 Tax=Aminobacter sp. MSH1 TaxID=374606 RepID=UPI00131F129A|nr:hypothetical protein [Aminobacter sp. MSH1]
MKNAAEETRRRFCIPGVPASKLDACSKSAPSFRRVGAYASPAGGVRIACDRQAVTESGGAYTFENCAFVELPQ